VKSSASATVLAPVWCSGDRNRDGVILGSCSDKSPGLNRVLFCAVAANNLNRVGGDECADDERLREQIDKAWARRATKAQRRARGMDG
jgi:hypothetical protein